MALLFHTSEKEQKSILVTDTHFHYSTKGHSDIESFEKSLEKKGMLETLESYEIANITRIYYSADETAVINAMNNKRYISLRFNNEEDRNLYTDHISKLKNYKRSEEAQKPLSAAVSKLFALVVSILITVALSYYAYTIENGEQYDVSGRRSGIKALMKSVAETLGSKGVAIIGGIIILYFAYATYKIYKNPPNNVVFS